MMWLCIKPSCIIGRRPLACGLKIFARTAHCRTVVCVTWTTAMPYGTVWVSPLTKTRKCYYARRKEKSRCACGRRPARPATAIGVLRQHCDSAMATETPARHSLLQSSPYILLSHQQSARPGVTVNEQMLRPGEAAHKTKNTGRIEHRCNSLTASRGYQGDYFF
jgi:hypothetical protein